MTSAKKSDRELPPRKQESMRRATRLEAITLGALCLDVVFLGLTMGNSQAMKTAWMDNLISMVPPLSFLISKRVRTRKPDRRFRYGYHRVVSLSFLMASFALTIMGVYLLYEALSKLLQANHPSIGTMTLFDQHLWAGWPMIAASTWSGISAAILGRLKLPLSRELHNKVLHADATMNKADWMVSAATVTGIIGIGFGWWWADAVAAAIISLDILKDGLGNLRAVFADLMDRIPLRVDNEQEEPILELVESYLRKLPWVRNVKVRLHEEGHLFFGEAFVVPRTELRLLDNIDQATRRIVELDWRMHDFTVTPVKELPREDSSDGKAAA